MLDSIAWLMVHTVYMYYVKPFLNWLKNTAWNKAHRVSPHQHIDYTMSMLSNFHVYCLDTLEANHLQTTRLWYVGATGRNPHCYKENIANSTQPTPNIRIEPGLWCHELSALPVALLCHSFIGKRFTKYNLELDTCLQNLHFSFQILCPSVAQNDMDMHINIQWHTASTCLDVNFVIYIYTCVASRWRWLLIHKQVKITCFEVI